LKGTFYVLPSRVEKRLELWRAAAAKDHEIGKHSVHHPCVANHGWAPKGYELECYTLLNAWSASSSKRTSASSRCSA
jgi:hypothetical protein